MCRMRRREDRKGSGEENVEKKEYKRKERGRKKKDRKKYERVEYYRVRNKKEGRIGKKYYGKD